MKMLYLVYGYLSILRLVNEIFSLLKKVLNKRISGQSDVSKCGLPGYCWGLGLGSGALMRTDRQCLGLGLLEATPNCSFWLTVLPLAL